MANYVYCFECVNCGKFYGEQALTEAGELLCPNCLALENIESIFVERIAIKYKPKAFEPELEGVN